MDRVAPGRSRRDPPSGVPDPFKASDADVERLVWLGAPRADALAVRGPQNAADDPRQTFAIPDRLVEDGEVLDLPNWSLRAIHTPGHTPGHLCFAAPDRRLLFSGDHVLPRITPNIAADRRPGTDALADYLDSLERVMKYDVHEVLPAHEWRFTGLEARATQITDHHRARLAELLEVVKANPGGVPWDLAGGLTWSRSWDQYDGHMRVAAVNETMSHLVHLVRLGAVAASEDPIPRYSVADDTPAPH